MKSSEGWLFNIMGALSGMQGMSTVVLRVEFVVILIS